MSLQTTNLGRLAAVIFLAWWLKRRPIAELGFWRGMAPPLVLLALVAGLILKQPKGIVYQIFDSKVLDLL